MGLSHLNFFQDFWHLALGVEAPWHTAAYTFSVGTVSLPRDDSFIDYDTSVCFCYQPAIICDNDIWWPLRNVFMPAINHATTFHTHASLHYISLGVYQGCYRGNSIRLVYSCCEYPRHVFSIKKSPFFFDHSSEVKLLIHMTYLRPILLYGHEYWILAKKLKSKITGHCRYESSEISKRQSTKWLYIYI